MPCALMVGVDGDHVDLAGAVFGIEGDGDESGDVGLVLGDPRRDRRRRARVFDGALLRRSPVDTVELAIDLVAQDLPHRREDRRPGTERESDDGVEITGHQGAQRRWHGTSLPSPRVTPPSRSVVRPSPRRSCGVRSPRMRNDERANDAQAEYWEERAASWIGMEEYTTLVTGPFGRLAMDRLAAASGERVLDIGCGTGPTTVDLARRVAPGGAVRGVDISPSLIGAARRAHREGVSNVEFAVGDAQTGDLGAAAFDAVFSQFGVMFFSDPAEAFANLRRSVRDGGRIAFACWQAVTANEWMLVPGAAVVGVTGAPPPMPAPGEPGPFSLSDPDHVEELLSGAGFRSIDVTPHSVDVETDADRVDMVVDASSSIGVVRDVIASSDDPSFHEQLRSAIRGALLERVQGDTLRLGAAAFIVAAEAGPG